MATDKQRNVTHAERVFKKKVDKDSCCFCYNRTLVSHLQRRLASSEGTRFETSLHLLVNWYRALFPVSKAAGA